jgi:hypothetical protein
MVYSKIIAVCTDIHTEHKTTLWGQNVELWLLNLEAREVTTGFYRIQFLT